MMKSIHGSSGDKEKGTKAIVSDQHEHTQKFSSDRTTNTFNQTKKNQDLTIQSIKIIGIVICPDFNQLFIHPFLHYNHYLHSIFGIFDGQLLSNIQIQGFPLSNSLIELASGADYSSFQFPNYMFEKGVMSNNGFNSHEKPVRFNSSNT